MISFDSLVQRSQGLENFTKRMGEITNMGTTLNSRMKPEFVSAFESRLQEAMAGSSTSSKSRKIASTKDAGYHPFVYITSGSEALDPIMLQHEEPVTKVNKIEKTKDERITGKVAQVSKRYGLPEELVHAVIKTESNYDQYAVSRAGAMGLMQLMPQTALDMGVKMPFDIEQNIEGGAKYLKQMLERYDGDLEKALAAYNAGPHKVDAVNGIPAIDETQKYVAKITKMLRK
jgi:soluble lytic murein transglycosylase-like protein